MSTNPLPGASASSVSAALLRRLAFARYVFRLGQQQAESAPPENAAALLSLQDAVELFLLVVCEHRRIQLKQNATLADYLTSLQANYGADVPHSTVAQRMNKARVSLKHYGIMPAPDDVRDFAAGTADFLNENSVRALGVGFNDVSLSDLISDDEVRQRVAEAQDALSAGQYSLCSAFCMLGADRLLKIHNPHERFSQSAGFPHSPIDAARGWSHRFKADLINLPSTADRATQRVLERISEFAKDICEAFTGLAEQVDSIAMGFDWKQYRKFKSLGQTFGMSDGSITVIASTVESTKVSAEFARDFVVDAALRLQPGPAGLAQSRAGSSFAISVAAHASHSIRGVLELQVVEIGDVFEYREIERGHLTRVHRHDTHAAASARLEQEIRHRASEGWQIVRPI